MAKLSDIIYEVARGSQGYQGVQGAQGSKGLAYIDVWSGGTTYVIDDVATLNGSSYRCKLGHINQSPPNATYWDLLVSKGDQGFQGSQGLKGDKGDQGFQGSQGLKGDTGDQGFQGSKGLAYIDTWSGATPYVVDDVVELNGSSYRCNTAHTNQTPPNASFWDLLVSKGDQGTQGYQGTQGLKGDTGDQGDQGSQGLKGDQGFQGSQGFTGISMVEAPGTNQTGTGVKGTFTAGTGGVVFGDVCYVNSSGQMVKADASATSTAPAVAMALGTASASATTEFIFIGIVRDDAWNWTPGTFLYLSETAGGIVTTAPTTANSVTQALGVATHADRIFFNPSSDIATHV